MIALPLPDRPLGLARTRLLAPALALLVGLLAACDTVNTAGPAQPQAQPDILLDERVITDASLHRKAYLTDLRTAPLDDGLFKVQAGLYNKTPRRERINYQWVWLDSHGILIDAATTPWQTVTLNGKEQRYLTAVAPTPDATDFQLKLLEADN
jgi:uncharacterized protein YcfL